MSQRCWVDGSVCHQISDDWGKGVLNAGQCRICQKLISNKDLVTDFFDELAIEADFFSLLDVEIQEHISSNFPFLEESFSVLRDILARKISDFKLKLVMAQTDNDINKLINENKWWLEYLLKFDDRSCFWESPDHKKFWESFLKEDPLERIDDLYRGIFGSK
ncbi:hypothetical protein A3I18_00020 [Candidatus Campbellbacteria bacterium RIFCSPLOWO2_02_FULL_35_11]|uniref:Uncharacterized protein n=2 Tax=Candidatus Campbelliibacteriota TaxID=1752727 RepID=A0A1F5ELH4_9BACT|nr:MAG: hypothetical protein A3E89_00400 [Candidatus Campbellbacteria bacterium RIFCSPHIGHO2_12_FULL_35_10]OGD70883.1 MAG: hypothetical protein A3I18_00020 [Candidatus Campbellbacteria bacterium RIFCSPLOWO2_02_FULL_35_11]